MRFITDRVHGSGVLSLDAPTGVPGHSVLDILHEKHPEPGVIDESAFMSCDDLPPLLDLDITADYVEHVAHQIQGSSGPCGSTALQWHGYPFSAMVYPVHVCVMLLLCWPSSGKWNCGLG